MKNKFLFAVALIISVNKGFCQDTILLITGDEIIAKVTEVGLEKIDYKKYENINGPTYSILKNEVFFIKFENGTKEVFKQQPTNFEMKKEKKGKLYPYKSTGFSHEFSISLYPSFRRFDQSFLFSPKTNDKRLFDSLRLLTPGISYSFLYNINANFICGVGASLDRYFYATRKYTIDINGVKYYRPYFALTDDQSLYSTAFEMGARYMIIKRRLTPYISFSVGRRIKLNSIQNKYYSYFGNTEEKVNISIKDNFFGEFGIGGRCFLSDKISLLIKMGTFYEKRFSEYKLDNNASSVYKLSDGWEFKTSIGFTF